MASSTFSLFLLTVGTWMALSTEAKLVPPPTNATTRESKQIMFMFPNQSIKKLIPTDLDELNDYELEARRRPQIQSVSPYASGGQQSGADERLFGLSSLLSRFTCPVCPSCPNCPTCAVCQTCTACTVCPTTCTETTVASIPITITVATTQSCTANVVAPATGFGQCTVVTARPSGVFSVIFVQAGRTSMFWSTAFVGIMPTCPNTKITLTCGTIPTDYIITTQNGKTLGAGPGGALTETGFMQVMVSQQGTTGAAPATIQCSWAATP